jgi:hypothetical protein
MKALPSIQSSSDRLSVNQTTPLKDPRRPNDASTKGEVPCKARSGIAFLMHSIERSQMDVL